MAKTTKTTKTSKATKASPVKLEIVKAAPAPSAPARDPRMPPPGTRLERDLNGKPIKVLVTEEGVEWNGKTWGSLSMIATTATGTNWNGYIFFGLQRPGTTKAQAIAEALAKKAPAPARKASKKAS